MAGLFGGALAFGAPALLWALAALPILWVLLRLIPPAPLRRRFPGVVLLLGLDTPEREARHTPWWLILLRAVAIAAAILGFAGPVLTPDPEAPGKGPLLVLIDGGWADAGDWARRRDRAAAALDEAARAGRPAALVSLAAPLSPPEPPRFGPAADLAGRLGALAPAPWAPAGMTVLAGALPEGDFDTLWISDGLDWPGRAALAQALAARGRLDVSLSDRAPMALPAPLFAEGKLQLAALRLPAPQGAEVELAAIGPDPSGIERDLGRARLVFAPGADRATATLDLAPELRNRITHFTLLGQRSAGAVALADDSLRRRKVAILGAEAGAEGLQVLSPTHYLQQALAPTAELIEGSLTDVLPARPDVIILADVARLTQTERDGLLDWLETGGLLLRFAGPRVAAGTQDGQGFGAGASGDDPLMPVRLRAGGRAVGGAMSWDQPKRLAPFPETSPFHGLPVPDEVTVTEQVLAEPDPDLAARTIAALEDGTPLVTRRAIGQGQVVLFHITANADWSNLPLSGLWVRMLERLAVSARVGGQDRAGLEGLVWTPERLLDGFGQLTDAGTMGGVAGKDLAQALAKGPGPGLPPGLWRNESRRVAVNAVTPDLRLSPALWPASARIEALGAPLARPLGGPLLALALALLALDALVALILSGRMPGRAGRAAALVLTGALALTAPPQARADATDTRAIEATRGVVLAHVLTGDAELDQLAEAGLRGLGQELYRRTAIEPEAPMGVDLETDDLAFFPFLYWPISPGEALPSPAAYARLNRFLRSGGMILFDTRDGDIAGFGGGITPEGQTLQTIAAGLDIPPLEIVPQDHVLTRAFYLLDSFPGRADSPEVWVEAAPPDAEKAEGMPFRNLNDGVTPVILGGNDWAGAWAVNPDGSPMLQVGHGLAGEDQREMAYRFGINVVMHVLTGNYKSDQVHVPALLERLGQ